VSSTTNLAEFQIHQQLIDHVVYTGTPFENMIYYSV